MNILLFSVIDFPNGDASSAHAGLIVKGLRGNGHNALLLVPHASLLGNVASNQRWKGHHQGVPFCYMSKSTTRPVGALKGTLQSLLAMLNASLFIIRRSFKRRLDAVILATPDSLEFSLVLITCLILRVPLFIWMVEMMTFSLDARGWRQKLRMAGFSYSEKRLPKHAAGYIVISSALMKYYEQFLPKERLLLSPILVDPGKALAPANPIGDRMTILHGGTFGEKDGVPYLVRAFAIVHSALPNTRLILTGKSPNQVIMGSIRTLVQELGLVNAVEFTGFVSRNDLKRIQQEAHVFLVCRTKSVFARYGFPWKLGEYALTGKPVVATNVGDIESVFGDRESIFLAEPEDPDSIAKTLIEVLSNYENAEAVGSRGRDIALNRLNYLTETQRISFFIKNAALMSKKEERPAR
jgi:glycosyltransferase involved in cell wall biosynthesis